MFEQTFVEGANSTRKASSVFVSFLIQCSLVIVGILIPLIYTETLPKTQLTGFLVAPPPPPPPPPPPAAAPVKVVKTIPRQFDAGKLTAPKQIPKDIAMIKEEDIPPAQRRRCGRCSGWRTRRRSWWRHWWYHRLRSLGSSTAASGEGSAKAGHTEEYSGRRKRSKRETDSSAEACLSAIGETGSYSRNRSIQCRHRA